MSFHFSRRGAARLGVGIAAAFLLASLAWALGTTRRPAPPGPAERRARSAVQAMLTEYYNAGLGLLSKYPTAARESHGSAPTSVPNESVEFDPAEVWGYSWALAALEDAAQLPGGARYAAGVRRLANNLSYYWDAGAPIPGYAPTLNPAPGAIKFFDDNAWAGLDLVGAYHLTRDSAYLRQAQAVFRYEESGWDRVAGGIYWNDERLTRNTASTAPAAELAVYLYRDTHQRSYLQWAERIYAWEIAHLVDHETGQVYENIDGSGNVAQTMWSYNQGAVIGGGVLLYSATHRDSYLRQAQKTASFVLHRTLQSDGTFAPEAQFNGVLVDNLQLLYSVTRDPAIRRAVQANAQLAWTRARSGQGLIANDWAGPPPVTADEELLTQTGAVRLLCVNAILPAGGFGRLRL